MNPIQPEIRHSPAAERNRGPILLQLQRLLPAQGTMLEVAAGSGQHAAHFAAALPQWSWIASEADATALASIAAWCRDLANVREPLHLDLLRAASRPAPDSAADTSGWPGVPDGLQAIYGANLLHIAPWVVCPALMRGAAHHLAPAGQLLIYGPFIVEGEPLADSNRAFDSDLRQRDPSWGLRRLSAVVQQAADAGLRCREAVPMPANNRLLVFERPATPRDPSPLPAAGQPGRR